MLRVTVLIPAYNEESTILELLRRVKAQSVPEVEFEVIVVDDGSSDRTLTLLNTNRGLYDKLIQRPRNGGKGAAVREGLAHATGDYVLFQDADLEYDPSDYANLLQPVLRFNAEVVIGSRMLAPPWTRVHYFWHKVGNELLTFLFNILYNTTFTDTYTCYLLYRRSLLAPDELVSNGWDQHAEILCRIVGRACSCYEVPISYAGRTYAEGKKIRARHAAGIVAMFVKRRLLMLRDRRMSSTATFKGASAPERSPWVNGSRGPSHASPLVTVADALHRTD